MERSKRYIWFADYHDECIQRMKDETLGPEEKTKHFVRSYAKDHKTFAEG